MEQTHTFLKKTLVIGVSLNPSKYSYLAVAKLVSKGHPVVAIGLKEGVVAGIKIASQKRQFNDIDTVSLYLNPKRQQEYYDYIMSLHPKRIIFNPGTENPEFYKLLEENSIGYEVACTLVLLGTNQY